MTISSLLTTLFKPNVVPNWRSQTAWAILRAVVGIMMIHNGLEKLANIESFAEAYVSYIGLPFPIFFSYVAAFTELIGAPLVIIGLFTRPAAFGLFSTMCVAMYHHIKVAGLSIPYLELSAVYAACFLFLAANGGGLFSTDALIINWLDNSALTTENKQTMRLEKAYTGSEAEAAAAK
ncbi:DoxX family protein [Romeria aff. gracilis LEGE 07310]|uniref:DoxX family protein n=1 Tax=Vasconcelosia minhoensis LEGE 07310 TaxID=915328 RepID=A0A8J7ATI8_9CYAN|nr:DoxX family protein [Romeria gracilis]MBE9080265.1 DoxX family protein [Romeria aff. gracilis LEGE 07310]